MPATDSTSEPALVRAVMDATATVKRGLDESVEIGQRIQKDATVTQRLVRRVSLLIVIVIALSGVVAGEGVAIIALVARSNTTTSKVADTLAGSRQARSVLLDNTTATRAVTAKLDDCTTPGPNPPPDTGHTCYDNSIRRQEAAVAQVVEALGGGR